MYLSKVLKQYTIVPDRVVLDDQHVQALRSAEENAQQQEAERKQQQEAERRRSEERARLVRLQQEQQERESRERAWEAQRQEREAECRRQCERLTEQARREEEELKEQARQEGEQSRADARQEAARIVTEAETKKFEIRETAYREGHHQGHQEGLAQGKEEGRNEVNQLGKTLQDIIMEINAQRAELVRKAEPKVVDLALAIARKVIHTEIAENKDIIRELVRESIQRLKKREQVVVRVNPDDLENLKEYKNDLLLVFNEIDELDIREDRNVARGGCLVETESSMVDSRLETRLDKIEKEINRLK